MIPLVVYGLDISKNNLLKEPVCVTDVSEIILQKFIWDLPLK